MRRGRACVCVCVCGRRGGMQSTSIAKRGGWAAAAGRGRGRGCSLQVALSPFVGPCGLVVGMGAGVTAASRWRCICVESCKAASGEDTGSARACKRHAQGKENQMDWRPRRMCTAGSQVPILTTLNNPCLQDCWPRLMHSCSRCMPRLLYGTAAPTGPVIVTYHSVISS